MIPPGPFSSGAAAFKKPHQVPVWVASDDFAFAVEYGNDRVQVLTPTLDFYCFIGVGQLSASAPMMTSS
jgi:hypothetical protein